MLLRRVIRWVVVVIIALHGLLHLLGAVKGFGWAAVPALTADIGPLLGFAWLCVGLLVLAVAVLLAQGDCPWWVPLSAALLSQVLVVSAWQDARAGTVVNVLLLAVAGHAWARTGPRSLRADYARHVEAALAAPRHQAFVAEGHLAALPEPVVRFLRQAGAVDRPAVVGFRASIHGRIRGGPTKPWMPFTGEQVNVYGADPCRIFFMDATMLGLPVDVLHVFARGAATMRVRLASARARSSRAPAPRWTAPRPSPCSTTSASSSPRRSWGPRSRGRRPAPTRPPRRSRWVEQTVTADLRFDAVGRLVDFVSDDRLRASADGRTFTRCGGRRPSAPSASGTAVGYAAWARRAGTHPSPRAASPTSSSPSTSGRPSRARRGWPPTPPSPRGQGSSALG